jgi:FAD/FMN-containing dehydrogenase
MGRYSDTNNRDLFEAALAGQGQCAIITRAVVRLVPAPATIREYVLPNAELCTLLQDAAQLAEEGRFDGVIARLQPAPSGAWTHYLIGTSYFTPPDTPDNTVLLAGLSYLRYGRKPVPLRRHDDARGHRGEQHCSRFPRHKAPLESRVSVLAAADTESVKIRERQTVSCLDGGRKLRGQSRHSVLHCRRSAA